MTTAITPAIRTIGMKLEVIVIPVSDVELAKQFYGGLGWRLDADYASGDDYRVIQFTPPGSGASVIFGKNVTAAAPGSAQGLYLIVSDIEAARQELLGRGVKVSESFHHAGGVYTGTDEPYLFGRVRVSGPDPEHRSYRSYASFSGGRSRSHAPSRGGSAWRAREADRRARRELAGLVRRVHRERAGRQAVATIGLSRCFHHQLRFADGRRAARFPNLAAERLQ
jgi:predicted enzyme related to lactoylglutathione lyase